MNRILTLILIIASLFTLSSCILFGWTTTYPGMVTIHSDMVEYTEDEVLGVAKDKYSVTEWIFTDAEIHGEAWYDAEGAFCLEEDFVTDFVNGDNIENAMTAFAGKNGGHDIQGRYRYFLCYVALGECTDGYLKFVYYNTNVHKDAELADTIGASDYALEVSPTEIVDSLFSAPMNWGAMTRYLNNYKNMNPVGFDYSGERLSVMRRERYGGISYMEFYKENGEVVFDLYYDKQEYDGEEKRLVYSTSDRYGVIYNYYGLDKSQYFDITKTVTQSEDEENVMKLWAFVEAKEIDGIVLYSNISYRAEYQILRDGKIMTYESADSVTDKLNFDRGYGMEKIDGVDHTETANFIISDFYIFYEKNSANNAEN